jgi:plasmid stabilization system protein ParE
VSRYVVEILPAAETEVRDAFLWYVERSPVAADAFRAEVFDAIDGLEDRADMWPENEDRVRRYVLKHFPSTVFYELIGSVATVLAVGHQRRRPGYWRER